MSQLEFQEALEPAFRQQFIMQQVRQAPPGSGVRIKDLAVRLGVHEMTVRRDLGLLNERGQLERTHGGARLRTQTRSEVDYGRRTQAHPEAKARIARAALEFIKDGDTIGLDASTTDLALARLLVEREVSAVTTGLDIATQLASSGVPFVLAGGHFHAPARSFTGGLLSNTLSKLRLDVVFFSCAGFTLERSFTDHHLPEFESKEALLSSRRTRIALVDHSKFGVDAFCQIVPLERVRVLITDLEPEGAVRQALERRRIELRVPQP